MARDVAEQYLTRGPTLPIRARSRFGPFGVFARRLLYRVLRPYMTRQREFELAIVNGLRELEELVGGVSKLAHSETASAQRTAEEATNTAREALRTAGEPQREILPHLEAVQARAKELGSALERNQARL